MERNTQKSIQAYGDEITTMIAETMHNDLENRRTILRGLADSVSQLTESGVLVADEKGELKEFLLRKAAIHDLVSVMLFDTRGLCMADASLMDLGLDAEQWFASENVQKTLRGDFGVGVLTKEHVRDQKVFYTIPVTSGEEEVGVLVGVFAQTTLQKRMDDGAYKGRTLSCIVDETGTPVVTPSKVEPFLYLDEIYRQGELSGIEKMLAEREGRSVFFEGADGESNLLAVDPLDINGWHLLSIVPVSLLMEDNSLYIRNFFYILAAILIVFIILLQVIYTISRRSYEQMYQLTYEDTLTGGWNGKAFRQQYRTFLQDRNILHHAVVMLNVRDFSLVNERLGFSTGDLVLKSIYQSVLRTLFEERMEFVCRSETDHFFICLDESDPAVVQKRVDRMIAEIRQELEAQGIRYPITVLAGCCIDTDPDWDVQLVKERARIAERHNRPEYKKCLFWDGQIVARYEREAELEYSFDAALENREFEVLFQPKVELESGRPIGAEALVRWNHPTYGLVMPGEFIPLLERGERIQRLDLYVFDEVCRFFWRRKEAGLPWYPVSVNLSRNNFYDTERLEAFFQTAEAYQLPAKSVEFEITESIFVDNGKIADLKRAVERIREHGFFCSLDDFGSGYSSLGILREFDVDTIKLDRSFFLDMSSQKARDIVQSVVDLARELNIRTVAEGIEMERTVKYLKSIGCTAVQGYYFSRPLPEAEYGRWLEEYEPDRKETGV